LHGPKANPEATGCAGSIAPFERDGGVDDVVDGFGEGTVERYLDGV
jgi:hypothetical protein